ncbi:hypothetical protein ACJRO7_007444 [Eucalyptus globulus]|uniref:TFIIS N-terminal domain-containing protein n=1 Tax=Eucalyptus globulus TaxID=34317 RepID=A0ABD3IL70_EUCGL
MSKSLDYWRAFFRGTNADVFEFIDNAIAVAAHDLPDDFRSRRGRIMERLYSCETGRHAPSEESEANGDSGVDVEQEAVGMDKESCCSCGEARAFADETDERSRVFGEVLRIKQVLDKSRLESASALSESLRRLQSMAITLDILETTKIGISVNNLRRNCRSKQIAQLAHGIIGQWKAMVDPDGNPCNIREKNSAIQKPTQQLRVVKPNGSSQSDLRTTPPDEIMLEKFDKERKARLEKPNKVAVCSKRQLAGQKDKLKFLQEVAIEIKFEAAKRRIQERYQREANAKKQRAIQDLNLPHLPKQAASDMTRHSTTERSHKQQTNGQR